MKELFEGPVTNNFHSGFQTQFQNKELQQLTQTIALLIYHTMLTKNNIPTLWKRNTKACVNSIPFT